MQALLKPAKPCCFNMESTKQTLLQKQPLSAAAQALQSLKQKLKIWMRQKTALKITDSDQNGSIAIMKHEMIAYAVGKLGEESGLFRFQLSDNGSLE